MNYKCYKARTDPLGPGRMGRPLGSEGFIEKAERLLQRDLKKKKPGPKGMREGRLNIVSPCHHPYHLTLRVSLAKSGVNTSRIPEAEHCWHKHDKSLGHIIRAEAFKAANFKERDNTHYGSQEKEQNKQYHYRKILPISSSYPLTCSFWGYCRRKISRG